MKCAKYEKYKPSNIAWIGDIPVHWVKTKFAYTYSSAMGQTILKEELTDEGLPVFSATEGDHYFGKLESPSVMLVPGDLVIPARGNSIGAVKLVTEPATSTQTTIYCKKISKSINSKFAYWFATGLRDHLFGFTQTAIPQITVDQVSSNPLLAPPLEEQQTIARFLDAKTAQIDALVAQKRQLIDKLKEKRQALIARTVTRGLPPEAAKAAGLEPNPEMKDSGVDWLGPIPKVWKVVPLKWRARCFSGDAITTEDVEPNETTDSNIPVIGGNGLMGYAVASNLDHQVLVIGRVGALCGNVHIVNPPAWITDNALVLGPKTGVFDNRYLAHILRLRNLNDIAAKTAQPLITGTQVRDQRVPCPSMPEQIAVADFLDSACLTLDELRSVTETAVDRLTEYRLALITSAVTGKIDVRGSRHARAGGHPEEVADALA